MQETYSSEELNAFVSTPSDVSLNGLKTSHCNLDDCDGMIYSSSSHPTTSPSRRSAGFSSTRQAERTLFTHWMENDGERSTTLLASDRCFEASYTSPSPRRSSAESTNAPILPAHAHTSATSNSKSIDAADTDFGQPKSHFVPKCLATLSPLHRNVLKCSIAYFMASLFTFCPYLSNWISDLTSYGPERQGPTPSGHMVATIAVYYNPAKTIGGMLEADLFCVFGLLYASIVCLSSMSLFWWLELQPGWEWLGDVIAILWIGVSMSAMAWMKVWMRNPSFNTACSMVAIIIFVVLVKEGGLVTLLQVSSIVICGSIVSNLTCCIFWPQTATRNLEKDIATTLRSFSTLITRLADTFLLEHHSDVMQNKLHKAVEDHQNSFTKLRKNLNESRTERLYTSWKDNEGVVDSMNRLAQHLNGLRSTTKLRHKLMAGDIPLGRDCGSETDSVTIKAVSNIFESLINELSSPLKALKDTCIYALEKLHEAFEQMNTRHRGEMKLESQDFAELIDAVEMALVRFDATSDSAILRVYRREDEKFYGSGRLTGYASQEHEIVFIVYFFIFTLQEFAQELILLIECIERVYLQTRHQSRSHSRLQSVMTLVSRFWTSKSRQAYTRRPGLRRSLSHIIPIERNLRPGFPKIHPHAPDTIQTPSWNQLSSSGQFKKVLWTFGKMLGEQRSKYAIKAGMATAILASPAFYDTTRPLFIKYWGDWALISCFVVLSPTIGATNHLSLHRIMGTLFGATVAAGIFSLFPNSPVTLSAFGFAFSMPCFYYALSRPQYASTSRFVLLTYNLTCLYSYNLREKYVDVLDISFHRALAVTVGVLWAAIISRLWWPSEARRELNKALGDFCLNLGWLYTRLVASNSQALNNNGRQETELPSDRHTLLPIGERGGDGYDSIKEFMAMELHLQIKLIEIQGLLAQAKHEPRLKGPFPVQLYRDILISLQAIIDKLHSVRCVTTRQEWRTTIAREFILPVNKERREMAGNVVVILSILASAFHLKAPLPPYLPPCETSRQRLVNAIRELDIVKERNVKGSRQLLYFAYALTMKGVTEELEKLGNMLQNAFGVIGQSREEFEALFMYQETMST
ncbi:hypothetical protein APHAL10511_004952 [Amanita phalloides]|nr:hypothetical protein APHAL10511_004952 [Amanita phalloides]